MDCAVNKRLNLSERNCLNLCERHRYDQKTGKSKRAENQWPRIEGFAENQEKVRGCH